MSEAKNRFPPGWDEERVREVIEHYDSLTEEGLAAEIEAALADEAPTAESPDPADPEPAPVRR